MLAYAGSYRQADQEQTGDSMDPFQKQILDFRSLEFATTMRVLRAYPQDKLDMRPAEKSRTAIEMVAIFIREEYVCRGAIVQTVASSCSWGVLEGASGELLAWRGRRTGTR